MIENMNNNNLTVTNTNTCITTISEINHLYKKNQQLKEQLKNFENIKLTKVNTIEEATHWIPRYDKKVYSQIENAGITLNNPYKIYIDEKDLDYFFYDDKGESSTIWLAHDGDLVILEV